jgi:hypothetical protein
MKISIGDNNKIKSSVIGESNREPVEEKGVRKVTAEILVGILITIIGGLILAFIMQAVNPPQE